MWNAKFFQAFANDFIDSLPPSLQEMREEFRLHLQNAFITLCSKMNLVTRDEFDAQARVLAASKEKLKLLEDRIRTIEVCESKGFSEN